MTFSNEKIFYDREVEVTKGFTFLCPFRMERINESFYKIERWKMSWGVWSRCYMKGFENEQKILAGYLTAARPRPFNKWK